MHKQTLKYLSLLVIMALTTHCQPGKTSDQKTTSAKQKPIKTILCGMFSQFTDSSVTVSLDQWDPHNFIDPFRTYTTTTNSGYFRVELKLKKPQKISLTVKERRLLRHFGGYGVLMEPGDSLYLQIDDIDHAQLPEVTISGRGVEKQKLLSELTEKLANITHKISPLNRTLPQRIEVATARYSTLQSVMNQYTDKVAYQPWRMVKSYTMAGIYSDVARFIKKEDLTDPAIQKLYREQFKPFFNITEGLTPELIISSSKHSYVLTNAALLDYLISHSLPYGDSIKNDNKRMFDILKEAYAQTPLQDWILAQYIIYHAKRDGWTDVLETCVTDFNLIAPDSVYYEQVKRIRHKLRSTLAQSAPAYDFSLPDVHGNEVSLHDFRGKVVLIDFMFYGCVGCKLMTPALVELEEKFSGSEVAFVSISIDQNRSKVEKAIGSFSSPGAVHLYTNGEGLHHEAIKAYGIESYPTLVLIDQEGKIVSARAPDPRTEEGKKHLTGMIENVLNKNS